jgi:RNA polymerase sigma factor (sigma-70 family)
VDAEELVREHSRLAFWVVNKWAAFLSGADYDDACQVSLIRLWAAAKSFDPRRGTFQALAVKSCRRAVGNFIKARRRHRARVVSLDEARTPDGRSLFGVLAARADSDPDAKLDAAAVDRVIERLSPARQRVARLTIAGNMNCPAAAAALGVTHQAITSLRRAALGEIRQQLHAV